MDAIFAFFTDRPVAETTLTTEGEEVRFWLALLGFIVAFALVACVAYLAVMVIWCLLASLLGKIRNARDRRRAAADVENARELPTWSASGVTGVREEGNFSGETLRVGLDLGDGTKRG